ncbi:MAG TPA: HNH endonuclease [Patescibacteria group bacterium]|nr:HNH endonuclease [Patescibacteria group bacterium]
MIKYPRTYFGLGLPKENDVADGKLINKYNEAYIYKKCISCGTLVWTSVKHQKKYCNECRINKMKELRGSSASNWKGGRFQGAGYTFLTIPETDPLYKYTDKLHPGKILEHRYLMMQKLGRSLESNEHVHHINGNKSDNRIENLDVLNDRTHSSLTQLQKKIQRYRKRLNELEEEYIQRSNNTKSTEQKN